MPRKLWLILLLALPLSNCGNGPKVKVCVSDPAAGGFDCYDENSGKSSFIAYQDSDKYVAFDPSDAQALLNYCSQNSK